MLKNVGCNTLISPPQITKANDHTPNSNNVHLKCISAAAVGHNYSRASYVLVSKYLEKVMYNFLNQRH